MNLEILSLALWYFRQQHGIRANPEDMPHAWAGACAWARDIVIGGAEYEQEEENNG